MSITISTYNEICNSPLNQSKAKMLYSFSRGDRFDKMERKLCDKYYELPNANSSRAPSFGIGSKSDFTKILPNTPPPNSYNIKGLFEDSKKNKTGFGFGQGRDEMQSTGPLSMVRVNKNPGPGSYDLRDTLYRGSFCLRPKTQQESSLGKKNPGPGSCNQIPFGISGRGNYFLSKHKSSGVASFNPKCSTRFRNKLTDTPGPGSYQASGNISPDGRYFDSRFRCSLVRSFPLQDKQGGKSRSETPGPGNYRLPSEFGHYVSRESEKQNI